MACMSLYSLCMESLEVASIWMLMFLAAYMLLLSGFPSKNRAFSVFFCVLVDLSKVVLGH